MKTLTIKVALFFILTSTFSYAQTYEATSNVVFISSEPSLSEKVETNATQLLKVWVQKDQYEKMEDYQQRISKEGMQKQEQIFVQQAIASLAESMVNWKDAILDYDPDHETYKISIKNLKPFLIQVPNGDEAQNFRENFSELIFMSPKFTIDNEALVLLELEIKNPFSDKSYILDKSVQNHSVAELDVNIGKISLNLPSGQGQQLNEGVKKISVGQSDVDFNIPKTKTVNDNAYAVVIGNKDYTNIKNKNVDFAINDAAMIKQYLIDVLGYKPGNIIYKENAAKGDFESIFGNKDNYKAELYDLCSNPESEIFVYYSGHGAPSQYNKKGYIVPVECKPNNVEFGGYPIEQLYSNLGKIRSKFVTVVIDACYSGNIYENISPLGIPIEEAQFEIPNGIVLTATSSNETANWHVDQQHGLFTYYILKGLQNKDLSDQDHDGNLTVSELYSYVSDNNNGVPYFARMKGQRQTPNIKGNGKSKVLVKY